MAEIDEWAGRKVKFILGISGSKELHMEKKITAR